MLRGETISLHTTISDDRGRVVAESRDARKVFQDIPPTQIIVIDNPSLWSVDNPALYTAPVDRFDPASFPDRIQFSVSVRGQGIFHEKEERWIDRGLESKDNFYYRGAYCDVVRAIDFVCSLPEADTDRIFAYGESQGGAFSFVSAALDPRIRACAPAVPFMGDFADYWKIVWWPVWEIFETAEKEGLDKDEVLEMLKWFDTKNFAHRITCPVKMSFGLQDTTCPPRTNFAPYNLVGSEKSYAAFPLCGHAMWREKDWNRQMEEFFKLFGSAESIHHRLTLAKSSSTEE